MDYYTTRARMAGLRLALIFALAFPLQPSTNPRHVCE
jgi:hypothetical protein